MSSCRQSLPVSKQTFRLVQQSLYCSSFMSPRHAHRRIFTLLLFGGLLSAIFLFARKYVVLSTHVALSPRSDLPFSAGISLANRPCKIMPLRESSTDPMWLHPHLYRRRVPFCRPSLSDSLFHTLGPVRLHSQLAPKPWHNGQRSRLMTPNSTFLRRMERSPTAHFL